MKKLLMIATLLLPMLAQALPFVPTNDPTLSTNYWYFLKTEGYYCAANDNYEIVFRNSADADNDKYLWCFVEEPNWGYRLYNKGTGRYLQEEGLIYDESLAYTYIEENEETNFYLSFYSLATYQWYYLFMNTFQDDYGFMRYMDASHTQKSVFSVELAKAGTPLSDDPVWTRFDANGVGYGYINGGSGNSENESSKNLCDNNASTKYFGSPSNCWIIMKASTDVAVNQYSIVTANDSRQFYDRALRSWTLEGSNDAINWVTIDSRDNYPMPFDNQVEVMFKVNSSQKFRYFRFKTESSAGIYAQISEVWINEQPHSNTSLAAEVEHGCGHPRTRNWYCSDCHLKRTYLSDPITPHKFENGVCTECGIGENETRLLYNGQALYPYYVKALRANRISENNWPEAPEGWNTVGFDDSNWDNVAMPIASPNHSDGPFASLQYNSNWYNEYNCFWIRRPFNIKELKPNAIFRLRYVHDDNMVVYVNGVEVINAQGWSYTSEHSTWNDILDERYIYPEVYPEAFQEGDNVLAIYIQQNWGGAYFDCELFMEELDAIPGDVNGDGRVNVSDVSALINMILGLTTMDNYRADVNGDGRVNVSDVSALINIILGIH